MKACSEDVFMHATIEDDTELHAATARSKQGRYETLSRDFLVTEINIVVCTGQSTVHGMHLVQ